MNNVMYLDPSIIGKTFIVNGATVYTCKGYAANETFLIIGALFDKSTGYTILQTFKLTDVSFIDDLTK